MKNDVISHRQKLLRRCGVLAALATTAMVASCATPGVEPWERDQLAKRSMQPDTHPLITMAEEHIYFSKEGSMGGRTAGGGGCGCN